MLDFKRFLLFLVVCLGVFSCAHKPSPPQVKPLPSQEEQLARLSKAIELGIEQAQKKGPDMVNFLAADIFLKANDSFMRGEFHLAAFLFEKLLKLSGEEPFLKKKYAVSLIYTQKPRKAQKILASLFEREKGKNLSNGLLLAGLYAVLGEKGKERGVYRSLLAHHPAHEEVCVFLAGTYISSKQLSRAKRQLTSCERKDIKSGVFSYYLGKLALEKKNNARALRKFEKALKRKPEFENAALEKGLLLARSRSMERGIEFFKGYLKKYPASQRVLKKLVELMFASGSREGLIGYVERLSRLESDDLNLKVRLGLLYLHVEKYAKAIGQFKEILKEVPDSDRVLYYLGLVYERINDHKSAETYFSRIPSDSGFFQDGNLRVARMLQALAQESRGPQDIERFINFVRERGEKFDKLRVDMAVILSGHYEGLRNYTKARDVIIRVRGESGYSEEHDYYLASLHEKAKDYDKAEKIIRQILAKNPNNAIALNYLGYSLLERNGSLNLAYKYIKRAIELRPGDAHIRDSLGWYYYKVGRFRDALKELKQAWEMVKTDPVIAKHLAQVYVALNRRRLAKKYFMEALKQCKFAWEREEIHKVMAELEPKRLPASP